MRWGPLVVLAALAVAACASTDEPAGPPPAEARADIFLWLLRDTLPPEGGQLVFAVVADGVEADYGVGAALDRWEGDGWREVGRGATCWGDWLCSAAARIQDPGAQIIYPAIGLGVADAVGTVEIVHVGDLDPGWYRLRKDGEEWSASGRFEVVAGVEAPPTLGVERLPALRIDPWLVEAAGPAPAGAPDGVTLVVQGAPAPDANGVQTSADGVAFERELSTTVELAAWSPDGWVEVGDLPGDRVEAPLGRDGEGGTIPQLEVGLPPGLDVGAYRLTRETPEGRLVHGFLVVSEPILAGP